jgi:predicted phage-related endonuclease
VAFDTLTYSKKLQQAGFTATQAEAQAEALRDVVEENLATKRDIELVRRDVTELETSLRHDIAELETSLRRDMKELEVRLTQQIELVRRDMEVIRRDIVIWLGGLIIASTTALGILMKLL